MENEKPQAVVAFHDEKLGGDIFNYLSMSGYKVGLTWVEKGMGVFMEKMPSAKLYLMDINLGNPDTNIADPAIEAYNKLEKRLGKKECVFYALSGNPDAREKAIEKGIPQKHIKDKSELLSILRGLQI